MSDVIRVAVIDSVHNLLKGLSRFILCVMTFLVYSVEELTTSAEPDFN